MWVWVWVGGCGWGGGLLGKAVYSEVEYRPMHSTTWDKMLMLPHGNLTQPPKVLPHGNLTQPPEVLPHGNLTQPPKVLPAPRTWLLLPVGCATAPTSSQSPAGPAALALRLGRFACGGLR